MSLKKPKNEAERPTSRQISDRRADRFRIAFRGGTRSWFTRQDHLPSASMNVDHGQVFRRGLMKTAVILRLHQVISRDGWPSSR